jgi:hypothetical protein
VTSSDFRFSTNQAPLRFAATGKSNFLPLHTGTVLDRPVQPLVCRKRHALSNYNYYWGECKNCLKRDTQWACWQCSEFYCGTCYDGDRRGKEADKRVRSCSNIIEALVTAMCQQLHHAADKFVFKPVHNGAAFHKVLIYLLCFSVTFLLIFNRALFF